MSGFYPKEKGTVHNTQKTGSADFFTTDLSPTNTPCCFRIGIAVDAVTKLHAMMKLAATDEVTLVLNGNQDLVADCYYIFDVLIYQGNTFNLQIDSTETVLECCVQEIPIGGVTTIDPV